MLLKNILYLYLYCNVQHTFIFVIEKKVLSLFLILLIINIVEKREKKFELIDYNLEKL